MEAVLAEERESVFAGETRRFAARLAGEGEKQMFACVCGYREKLSAFQERRKSAGAGKRDVAKYLQQQKDDKPVNSGMADALAKWLEKNQK